MEFKQEVKFIGITLHHILLWNRHIQETVIKVIRTLWYVDAWQERPGILRWTDVHHIIRYGAAAWYDKPRQGTVRNTLSKVQMRAYA